MKHNEGSPIYGNWLLNIFSGLMTTIFITFNSFILVSSVKYCWNKGHYLRTVLFASKISLFLNPSLRLRSILSSSSYS